MLGILVIVAMSVPHILLVIQQGSPMGIQDVTYVGTSGKLQNSWAAGDEISVTINLGAINELCYLEPRVEQFSHGGSVYFLNDMSVEPMAPSYIWPKTRSVTITGVIPPNLFDDGTNLHLMVAGWGGYVPIEICDIDQGPNHLQPCGSCRQKGHHLVRATEDSRWLEIGTYRASADLDQAQPSWPSGLKLNYQEPALYLGGNFSRPLPFVDESQWGRHGLTPIRASDAHLNLWAYPFPQIARWGYVDAMTGEGVGRDDHLGNLFDAEHFPMSVKEDGVCWQNLDIPAPSPGMLIVIYLGWPNWADGEPLAMRLYCLDRR
ncbi:TPA: hypothetical protein DIU46_01435 [Patescibacteria group bacterium]|nr:hypothetical protein [Patescibacteria group bacterium]HCR42615.1 hypothetical protein [Patescibacteria group bacterium]